MEVDPILSPTSTRRGPGTEYKGFFLSQSTELIGAKEMWNAGHDGEGWTIAVLDTGVVRNSIPLIHKVVGEACFSTNQGTVQSLCPGGATQSTAPGSGEACSDSIDGCVHGSHLATAALGDPRGAGGAPNEKGVAPLSSLISIKVASRYTASSDCSPAPAPCARVRTSDLIRGLEYLHKQRNNHDIAAALISLAEGSYGGGCAVSSAFNKILSKLTGAKIAVVAGTGNDGADNETSFPACVSGVVSTGSTGKIHTPQYLVDMVPETTNMADFMKLMAPGEKIRTAFGNVSGTSLGAAHVAGAIAVMRDFRPTCR